MKLRAVLLLSLLASAAPAQTIPAAIRVLPQTEVGPVDPLLYGQFAEFMFENIKGGMHAELLRGRGFEEKPNALGLPRYWERDPDDRNDDWINFSLDETVSYPGRAGEHSLKIETPVDDGRRRGIRQGALPIRGGFRYHGSVWAKGSGRLRVLLEADQTDGKTYAEADLGPVSAEWRQYSFSLVPGVNDPLAKLAILAAGKGTVWLDQASLLPGDAVDGVRADVMTRVRALKPAFLRWPGGNVAQDYFWTWGIGARDSRLTWINKSWKNEPEPSDFGTDEYLQFCQNVGAVPTLTVSVEGAGATPQLAADWVEYCNGPATSRWGAERAKNGHSAPYGVKVWEVGNEIWGNWVRGHSDAATYAKNFLRYEQAMRRVDPSIRLVAVGDNDMQWNRTVLGLIGKRADYLAVHHYYGPTEMAGEDANLIVQPLVYQEFYEKLRPQLPEGMKLAINEWNTTFPVPRQHSMESAAYAARMLNVFLRSRGLVAMSCVSDLVNGWSGGIIQASRHGVFVTPTYHVNAMYAASRPVRTVETLIEGPKLKNIPVLGAVTTVSARGEHRLHAVNMDPARTLEVQINGARPVAMALLASKPGAFNNFAHPEDVAPKRQPISGTTVVLPPRSVAVVELTL